MKLIKLFILGIIVSISAQLQGNIRLPKIFSSNMVLQQGQPNPVWGWADKGEKIVIAIDGKTIHTKAGTDGKWKANLPVMNYGGPHTLSFRGKNLIELKNILIGEVWLCSGQSNMGWQLILSKNGQQEVANANYPNIRIFSVPKRLSKFPSNDLEDGTWIECTPESARHFSGVAYFFGRYVYQALNVPVGLIHSSRGGTLAESWISTDMLKNDIDFKDGVAALEKADLNKIVMEREDAVKKKMKGVFPSDTVSMNYVVLFSSVDFDASNWDDINVTKRWEANGYTNIDGIAWYRKEINLTEKQAQSDMVLHLGKIDESDMVWVNGQFVDSTKNDFLTERNYRITSKFLKTGKNILLVRVEDKKDSGGLLGSPEGLCLQTTDGKIDLSKDWKIKFTMAKLIPIAINHYEYPSMLYNGMINPLIPFGIKGVIWYQGESNVARAKQYGRIFPGLITDWRNHWGQGDFPFLFVSLANYRQPAEIPGESEFAELRESQVKALSLPNTGMATAIDIGDAREFVHPENKQDVGYRLALNALQTVYKKDVEGFSPMFESMKLDGSKVEIIFNHVGKGLVVKDRYGYINGFAVAGNDKKFHWAKAELINDHTVRISSSMVEKPVAVRFGWSDNPSIWNLYSKDGLPAHPFRTDSWSRKEK